MPVSALRASGWGLALAILPAAAHAAGGMPQFDVTSFPTQIFWLVVSFALLYVLMAGLVLPRIGHTIEAREGKIQADLDAAQKANDAARVAAEAQREALAEARGKAAGTVRQAAEAAAAETTAHLTTLGEKLAGQIGEAERRIAEQRAQALAGLSSLATEITSSVLGKLVGNVDGTQVAAKVAEAVETARKGTK